TLETEDFKIWKQTRTGLLSYPVDLDQARAHLATTVFVQMALKPDILHVVGYPEADHAVTGKEVIESCTMARKAVEHALQSQIDLTEAENIQKRVGELVAEAKILIEAISQLETGVSTDALSNPAVLSMAVTAGLLDAPQLINNPYGRGEISTKIDHRGACIVIDKHTGKPISEGERVTKLLARRTG
ncbi:MAG: methionine synthase, partial [Chloroflexota bacterium]